MIICDIGRVLNLATLLLALFAGYLTIKQIYLNSFIEGAFFVVFSSAQTRCWQIALRLPLFFLHSASLHCSMFTSAMRLRSKKHEAGVCTGKSRSEDHSPEKNHYTRTNPFPPSGRTSIFSGEPAKSGRTCEIAFRVSSMVSEASCSV